MEPTRLSTETPPRLSRPRLERLGAFLIFGLGERHKESNAAVPSQWDRFVPYLGNIANQVGTDTFGVICNTDEAGTIEYICGVQVSEFPTEPRELSRLRVPPHTYAVFEHKDHVSTIAETWKQIWNHGLTDAGLQPVDGPSFERYGATFDGRTGNGGFEVWIPVKQ